MSTQARNHQQGVPPPQPGVQDPPQDLTDRIRLAFGPGGLLEGIAPTIVVDVLSGSRPPWFAYTNQDVQARFDAQLIEIEARINRAFETQRRELAENNHVLYRDM